MQLKPGDVIWQPDAEMQRDAKMTQYRDWLNTSQGVSVSEYEDLWQWSTDHVEDFWESVWKFFNVQAATPYRHVLSQHQMPGARWFDGAEMNWVQYLFAQASDSRPALLSSSEIRPLTEMSWSQLQREVGSVAATLRDLGVVPGDRVVAFVPNIIETVVAFLACASLGAIWSSCSPDFGADAVLARFQQISPKVLIASDGYQYNGRRYDKRSVVARLQEHLPSLKGTIMIPYLFTGPVCAEHHQAPTIAWNDCLRTASRLQWSVVPFNHPLWILYSSGTTGLPKPLVHSHGGILLSQLVMSALHLNLQPGDRAFWFSTTGWVMWNVVVGFLLTGATAVLYDGSPWYPNDQALWDFIDSAQLTYFGTSAAYLDTLAKRQLVPRQSNGLTSLRAIGSTGSPLSPETYEYVYSKVKENVWLGPMSGGTDVAGGFVGPCPLRPVRVGEMQCRFLGVKALSFDEAGNTVTDTVGELVVTEPMPSMPIYLWNDWDGSRYHASYFEKYPGNWCHGDWLTVTSHGGAIIWGRSDATINRLGVRIGPAEIYRVVESLPEVADSLVVDREYMGQTARLTLFVVLSIHTVLDQTLQNRIRNAIGQKLSPRFFPDYIIEVEEIPRTLNGKKLEVPIRNILMGWPVAGAIEVNAMANPESLAPFVELAAKWGTS